MTGAHHISGPAQGGLFAQLGRWLSLAAVATVGLFVLFVSATFALVVLGVIAVLALIAVGVFWVRAKLTGRPFGPRAVMEARMAELREQMGTQSSPFGAGAPFGGTSDDPGPVIDLEQTPQGWTVER